MLLGLAQAVRTADAVTGTGQLDVLRYGHVLRARQLVGVRGAGLAYDGLYYVQSVSHTIRRGSYTQSFSLARDGRISNTAEGACTQHRHADLVADPRRPDLRRREGTGMNGPSRASSTASIVAL